MLAEGLAFDLRLALRGLRRDRAFAVAAVVMLALAIGLNVSVFTVMDAMRFRGLPLAARSDRLVFLGMRQPSSAGNIPGPILAADFEAWHTRAQTPADLAFVRSSGSILFRDGD